MRRALWLVSALFATSAIAGFYTASYSDTQTCTAGSCTGSAPTSAAVGANLAWVDGFRLRVCAAAGQTLSGAGTMQAYLCDAVKQACYRNSGLDQAVTTSGVQCVTFPDFKATYITELADTVEFVASGVTVSGGAGLTMEIQTHRARQ